jgi:signal transduction histidine kinase
MRTYPVLAMNQVESAAVMKGNRGSDGPRWQERPTDSLCRSSCPNCRLAQFVATHLLRPRRGPRRNHVVTKLGAEESCPEGSLRAPRRDRDATVHRDRLELRIAVRRPAALRVRGKAKGVQMKLSQFIQGNHKTIVDEWETFARSLVPAAGAMTTTGLRDHAEEILQAIVKDLDTPQDSSEQSEKSMGRGYEHLMEAVGKAHAALRIEDGFTLSQLVAEYRALRASILRLFERAGGNDMRQVTRLNESIDEALAEATDRFMIVMNRTRDQFIAILGHDLRTPLSVIFMAAGLIAKGADAARAAEQILRSGERMSKMVDDLLDLTRTRLGSGIPIAPVQMDLAVMCRAVLAEFQAIHPKRRLEFRPEGDLRGRWDSARLSQALSNLVGNALQHGERDKPIEVVARVDAEEVVIDVHNEGSPIPPQVLANIFEPMVSHAREGGASTSVGLGLFIAREIVLAHGGTVTVTSTASDGTTFSVRLPHRSVASLPPLDPGDVPDEHDASGGLVVK